MMYIIITIVKILLSISGYDFILVKKHNHCWTEWKEFTGIRFRYCSMCGMMQRDLYSDKYYPVQEAYHQIIKQCFDKEHKIPEGWRFQ